MSASLPFLDGTEGVLVTDNPEAVPVNIFSSVLPHPCPQFTYRDKILPLIDLPFEITLFWTVMLAL